MFNVTVNERTIATQERLYHSILGKEILFTIADYKPKLGKLPMTDNSWALFKLASLLENSFAVGQ